MNVNQKTRYDNVASTAVLTAMLVSALSGAFVSDVPPVAGVAANDRAVYAAVEEQRP
jgi:hypothetical protein